MSADPMMDLNITQILEASSEPDTPTLRALLEQAYEIGALEGAATPLHPGDPATAEVEAMKFAVATRLALDTGRMDGLESVLAAHLARKSR
jgi:hypothetical protein